MFETSFTSSIEGLLYGLLWIVTMSTLNVLSLFFEYINFYKKKRDSIVHRYDNKYSKLMFHHVFHISLM